MSEMLKEIPYTVFKTLDELQRMGVPPVAVRGEQSGVTGQYWAMAVPNNPEQAQQVLDYLHEQGVAVDSMTELEEMLRAQGFYVLQESDAGKQYAKTFWDDVGP